jgi:hypothetical protein
MRIDNYKKFVELFPSIEKFDCAEAKKIANQLNVHLSTIWRYKKAYENPKPEQVKKIKEKKVKRGKKQATIDHQGQSMDCGLKYQFDQKVFKAKCKTLINLDNNDISTIERDGDNNEWEIIHFKDEMQTVSRLEIKIEQEYTQDKNLILELDYYLYTKRLKMAPLKIKTSKKKTAYSPFDAERNERVIYKDTLYRVLRCTITAKGCIQKPMFEQWRFANNVAKNDSRENYRIQRWVIYDVETCDIEYDNRRVFVVYMICARVFYPKNQLPIEDYIFESKDFEKLKPGDNFVVHEFINWLLKFICAQTNEGEQNCQTILLGFNNYKFDDHFLVNEIDSCISKINQKMPDHFFSHYYNQVNGAPISRDIRLIPKSSAEKYRDMDEFKKQYYSMIKFRDIRKFTDAGKSLADICKDYSIGENSKIDFDILKFNDFIKSNNYKQDNYIVNIDTAIEFFKVEKKKKDKEQSFDVAAFLRSSDFFIDDKIDLWELCKTYCKYDVISTFEIAYKIHVKMEDILNQVCDEFNFLIKSKNIWDYFSPAGLSLEILKKWWCTHNITDRFRINHNHYAIFIRQAYFAGRTDFAVLGKYNSVKGNLNYFDVTSEYPLAMTKKFPSIEKIDKDVKVGYDIDIEYYQNIIDTMLNKRMKSRAFVDFTIFLPVDNDFMGIFLCDLLPPDDSTFLINFAPMATRNETMRLSYQNTVQNNVVVNTSYMKNYIMCGYKIILKPYKFNTVFTNLKYIFKDFVNFFGGNKADAKSENNKSLAKLYKLILNSSYGKLAQKCVKKTKSTDINTIIEIDGRDQVEEDHSDSSLYLAQFITAEANFILFSTLYRLQNTHVSNATPLHGRCGGLLYMDTDSVIFDQDLCDELEWDFSEELGYWNEEKNYFHITWKKEKSMRKKLPNALIVTGKKSYILYKDEDPTKPCGINDIKQKEMIATKIKGLIGSQHDKLKSEMSSLLNYEDVKIKWEGIVKKTDKHHQLQKDIVLDTIKKTIRMPILNNLCVIESTNEAANSINDNSIKYIVSNF